jgi:hypothetical protein
MPEDVACTSNVQCEGSSRDGVCVAGQCQSCNASPGIDKKCSPCMSDPDACRKQNPEFPACLPSGECGECNTSSDCPKPDAAGCFANKCGPCTKDADCATKGPGICITDPDGKAGRCATAEQTIHVKPNGGVCPTASGAADGTAVSPFCRVSDAITATNNTKRVVLLQGPGLLDSFIIDRAGGPLYIVGKGGVRIRPGALPGIRVFAAVDVRVRDLVIDDGGDVGVLAEGDSIIRLNRCTITRNVRGGLVATQGAGFDISNTAIAMNGYGFIGNVTFSGAFLGTPTGGRIRRFRFNTVVDHPLGPGVVCDDNTTEVVAVLTANNPSADLVNCKSSHSRAVGENPMFGTSPYRLTSSSPCVDKVPATLAPADDIDGDVRPFGVNADCGADEFHP